MIMHFKRFFQLPSKHNSELNIIDLIFYWICNFKYFQVYHMSISDQDRFWLSTHFQNIVESSLQLSKAYSQEENPYQYKYVAINKLKKLLEDKRALKFAFIVHCLLGQIYSEVQQTSDSIRSYEAALRSLATLTAPQLGQFLNYLVIVYNMLGLNYINIQQNEQGIGCLAKAHDIYEGFCDSKGSNVYHNRSYQPKGRQFRCYFEGGIDHELMQEHFTLSMFYLAQAYTKVGLKQKAAQYCGRTLQRQSKQENFDINQFCHNLIGLSDYYRGSHFYGESQYLLLIALKILPEGKKKKMRSIVHTALGNMLTDFLKYATHRISIKQLPTEEDNQIINRQLLMFESQQQKFIKIELPKDLQGCKSIFRQANTQFKKALQTFVLDGYVTQHIQILQSQSKLYKYLCHAETSAANVFAMYQKRASILEPILKQLNPKAYPATWQQILVQVSQIYNEMYTVKQNIVLGGKQPKNPTPQKLSELNNIGLKSIKYYTDIIKVLEQDKDAEKNQQFYRSILNSKFNIAKTTSKLMSTEKKERVGYLSDSLKKYEQVLAFINSTPNPEAFQQQRQMTQDVINMMPNRIDRINYGQVSPLE